MGYQFQGQFKHVSKLQYDGISNIISPVIMNMTLKRPVIFFDEDKVDIAVIYKTQ